jgi:DNA (cytosine-5)-methyltransferase 1
MAGVMEKNCPIAVDLFAGAGGFGLGMEMAGFNVSLALETDAWACDTLRLNRPNMTVLQADIRDFHSDSAIREACPVQPDVIVGGPPCQGFSIAGPAQKDPADPRNSLFVNFARWVECLRPEIFVMENVKGLLSRRNANHEKVTDIIRQTFTEIGYTLGEIWILNAAEFGVPQIHERIFIVGSASGAEQLPPRCTRRLSAVYSEQLTFSNQSLLPPAVTLWDAISDLPPLEAGQGNEEQHYTSPSNNEFQKWTRYGSQILFNHVAMSHSRRLVERFKHIGWGTI